MAPGDACHPMGGDEAMIVAGLGFRHGVTSAEIVAIISHSLREASFALADLKALATVADRAEELGFIEAADQLNVPRTGIDLQMLRRAQSRVKTQSTRIMSLYGVGSIAEAAALAWAGDDAQLVLPCIKSSRVTCALAREELQ
jgi:cobalt-precorrin 5A hydrolase